ncbi:MAG: methyltransferase domain-containing protein [Longimicrobiales bacterium]
MTSDPGVGERGGSATAPRTEPWPTCPACGSDAARERFVLEDRAHGVPGRYRYVTCTVCGTVRQSPCVVDADLPDLYPPVYLEAHPRPDRGPGAPVEAADRRLRSRVRARIRDSVTGRGSSTVGTALGLVRGLRERAFGGRAPDEFLPRRSDPGRALDVGCGLGNQMEVLAGLGWAVEGVEVDPRSARAAADLTGAPVHVGDVRTLELPAGGYRLILLHHVVEHLSDPVAVLASLAPLLAPRGRVVLVYPNPHALAARRFGPAWMGWDAPRHLVLPPPSALSRLATLGGLRLRSRRTTARNALAHLAHSRGMAARPGVAATVTGQATVSDRALAALERALVAAGIDVGEEVIAVLDRAPGAVEP